MTVKSLTELYQAGRLAIDYPVVTNLTAGLSGADLLRAGRLLARLDPDDVLREHPGTPALTVALTGHGTLSTLVPCLTAEFARHGLVLRPLVGRFDSFIVELTDPESTLYLAKPDLTLCVLDPMVVLDEIPVPWQPADVEEVLEKNLGLIENILRQFQAASQGTLVLNTLPLPHRLAAQLVDHRSRAVLGAIWREKNARLLRFADRHSGVVVLDLDPLVAEGVAAMDPRLSLYARVHLSQELLACYAREIGHLARHLTGRAKKVLALDLDGTIWGGVLGDDGPSGIEVADSYRGESFKAFQRVIKQVGAQGILLAIVSKNADDQVREVLRNHPRMTLREDDFVSIMANWKPKPENLADLARILNLGVNSIVLADDSTYECGLVRHALPEVMVVQLGNEPAWHIDRLLREGWFSSQELTAEDRMRATAYRAELSRHDFINSAVSLKDYLRGLEMRVQLMTARDRDVPRVSQLTLRTNQFNFTSQRLQPAQVRELLRQPTSRVLAIHAQDRFGDIGIVGAIFMRRSGQNLYIDNFLLSCRAFSRGIEHACLTAVSRYARFTGAEAIVGEYRQTKTNRMAQDFYAGQGFELISSSEDRMTFRHDLMQIPPPPAHINLTSDLEGHGS